MGKRILPLLPTLTNTGDRRQETGDRRQKKTETGELPISISPCPCSPAPHLPHLPISHLPSPPNSYSLLLNLCPINPSPVFPDADSDSAALEPPAASSEVIINPNTAAPLVANRSAKARQLLGMGGTRETSI